MGEGARPGRSQGRAPSARRALDLSVARPGRARPAREAAEGVRSARPGGGHAGGLALAPQALRPDGTPGSPGGRRPSSGPARSGPGTGPDPPVAIGRGGDAGARPAGGSLPRLRALADRARAAAALARRGGGGRARLRRQLAAPGLRARGGRLEGGGQAAPRLAPLGPALPGPGGECAGAHRHPGRTERPGDPL